MPDAVSDSSLMLRTFIRITVVVLLFFPIRATAGTDITLLLTSNLQGRFSPRIDDQNDKDPMLLLAQSIIDEKEKSGYDLYLDLGNAFYPGPVSRFSYGSVMMDFFNYFNCSATVVSSRDISIGLANLEFLLKGKETKMLSANITRDNKPVFTPYLVVPKGNKKIGFIGLSSAQGMFDIADKQVLNISFSEYLESVTSSIEKLKEEGCTSIILLSGLSYRNNLELMSKLPEIDLTIAGGDSDGNIFSVQSSRVDLRWGRSIVSLLNQDAYYTIQLELGDGVRIKKMEEKQPSAGKRDSREYLEFVNRLTLWKDKFAAEENRVIVENFPLISISDERVADMLRHRYRCEVAIIDRYSVIPGELSGTITSADIMKIVNNDYPVFTYRLTGAELSALTGDPDSGFVITGVSDGLVQGYPVSETTTYSVCSTQSAYDRVSRLLKRHIDYDNSWMVLQDDIVDDIMSDRSIASPDFSYLNNRFRVLVNITLSNFYDRSDVRRGDTISTPPGKPEKTYRQWGIEDTVKITIYNRNHQLVLTPYIYFIKQDEDYNQNMLRGTLLYNYNLNKYLKPYHKSHGDTVLVDAEGRPFLIRETAGLMIDSEKITGKIGAGFEKQVKEDDEDDEKIVYGLETLVDATIPFTEELSYVLKLDSFIALNGSPSEKLKIRTELTNSLSFKLNSILGVSMKHKWFYLYSNELDESYNYSQLLFSIDLKTDFKLF